jgi:pimeloyl-ACP methyl ester carboxylesterase
MPQSRGRRAARRVAVVIAAGLLGVACTSTNGSGSTTAMSDTSAEARGPTFLPAECPNPLLPGAPSLDLGPEFECGYLTVPENRSRPDGPTIRIAVARARATSPNPKPDPIVYLAGGPGNSGLASGVGLVEDGWNTDRDVIVFDQRGTLKSDPMLSCPEIDRYLDAAVGQAPTQDDAARRELTAVAACRDRLAAAGWDLSAYNSTENAADLADLRVALGIPEWNVYGVSYGTDLALQTLRDHPDGIRTVVLDSVLPPQSNLIAEAWPNAALSYRSLFDACAAQRPCAAAFPDLEAEFRSLVRELTARPLTVTATDPATGAPIDVVLDGYTLANLVLLRMAPGAIAEVPELLHDLADGDGAVAAAALLATRPPVGLGNWGLNYGVICREHAPFTDLQQVAAAATAALPDVPEAVLARVPHLFTPVQNCEVWDVPAAPPSVRAPVTSDVPVLILSGGLDPITPTRWAQEAASSLDSSRLVVVLGAGHDVVHWEPACATKLIRGFLDSTGGGLDDGCLASLRIPTFVVR